MICGTITIEDTILHFHFEMENQTVSVTVCDALTGATQEIICPARAFAASMALGLDFDAMAETAMHAELYKEAEKIQFPAPELRWIP